MTHSAIAAAKIIQQKAPHFKPKFAMTLGSGLGDLVNLLEDVVKISYADLPDFPVCTVVGHAGNLYLGKLKGVPVAFLQGRTHFYEGTSALVAKTYVRAMKLIGAEFFFITNAAGAIRDDIAPGDLVLITDHINFQFQNILTGPNDDDFGPRFIGMEDIYDLSLREKVLQTAAELNITLKQGVYFGVLGPQFETPAEIRAFRIMGGDVIAMSAINEITVAHHCGMKVVMISSISNMAAGMSTEKLSHALTLSGVKKGAEKMQALVMGLVAKV